MKLADQYMLTTEINFRLNTFLGFILAKKCVMYQMKGTEGNSFAISANFVFSEDNFTDAKFLTIPTRKSLFEAL